MSETLPATSASEIEKILIDGDLSRLNDSQRVQYAKAVCDSVGLNLLTKPFEFMKLNGRVVLYATRGATDQLRKINHISTKITRTEKIDDLYVVTACGTAKDGRSDESTGAVSIKGLQGEALANAMLKAETKAKRRMTLSLCGLGLLDESEARDVTPKDHIKTIPQQVEDLTDSPAFEAEIQGRIIKDAEVLSYPQGYTFQTGGPKRKGKRVIDLSIEQLTTFTKWVSAENDAGKDAPSAVTEDFDAASAYLLSL